MSFTAHTHTHTEAPERKCPNKLGSLFSIFPPTTLEGHFRAGYEFRPNACLDVVSYDPEYCVPGDVKMEPGTYGAAKSAVLGMVQTAISCSMGEPMEGLREDARLALANKIDRAMENDLITVLDGEAVSQGPGCPCVLGRAAQYLASSSECGRGLILGPVGWVVELGDTLVWNGKYHTDFVGNFVAAHSVDNDTVYALDAALEFRISDVQILDELAPGITRSNDRVVRAEQLYTVAVDSCEIASFPLEPCVVPA